MSPEPGWYQKIPGVHDGEQDCLKRWAAMRLLHSDLAGKQVLDIGAAEGFFTYQCAALGASVLAAEAEPARVDRINRVVGMKGVAENVTARCFDIECYLVQETAEIFDAVICLNVLHHLAGPLMLIYQVHRTLKAHGVFYLGIPEYPGNGIRLRKHNTYHLEHDFTGLVLARLFQHVAVVLTWHNSAGNHRTIWECVK